MQINYMKLPVYEQKDRILSALKENQVIVVQSPTGSGKTTQLPVILHEAGFSENGIIAVTQPRRIAALSVSEFIAKQLNTTFPGLVGYKMRFEDKTDPTTKIKIMTDGILLQEMKLDPFMSKYSVIMVDEAHERSLNIDFALGLLKRVLDVRKDFKVIVSSATMNAESFSHYFKDCPIVNIETQTYPVQIIYDPPEGKTTTATETGCEALLDKIEATIERILDSDRDKNRKTFSSGDILVFLPGEKIIKDCIYRLSSSSISRSLHIIPLYGRLPKEEQERVFDPAPKGKKKVVISTNIAETSVTINGITSVIDSGLAKLNFYSPRTFTSSLVETPVSRASCNQRKGRAGRTCEGTCYRLYPRKDFETRQEYTTEEIYRTDLSEVVLRMSELGITDFESFDFISPPGHEGLIGAVNTLTMLSAIDKNGELTSTGKLMVEFPLEPRVSRIIVESIMRYPSVLEESLIASAFLSAQSPFVLPAGQEMDARQAHHRFRDENGDFATYLKIFRKYEEAKNKEKFCKENFLDERVMAEIQNIKVQLEEIVSERLQFPITSGGSIQDYLCCISSGMIQFVCVRQGRENYRSLTQDHITVHPGSSMFKENPQYIVAGEIVRTSRMFAMSVSPLTRRILDQISPRLEKALNKNLDSRKNGEFEKDNARNERRKLERTDKLKGKDFRKDFSKENLIEFGNILFESKKIKGKKTLFLPLEKLIEASRNADEAEEVSGFRGVVLMRGGYKLLDGEKMNVIFRVSKTLNLTPVYGKAWPKKANFSIEENSDGLKNLIHNLSFVLRVTEAKSSTKEMGFITLFTDGKGNYWFKVSRGIATAINESLASLEALIDDTSEKNLKQSDKEKINTVYRLINSIYSV